MNRKQYILDIIANIVTGSKSERVQTAQMILERLEDEGVLHLGHGDAEVDRIVDTFKAVFGTTKATKIDRFAAHRLASKYGAQAIAGIVTLLGQHRDDKYAPVVGSVTQLEDKIVQVITFLRRLDSDETIAV